MEKVKAYLVKVAESAKQPQSTITAALLEAYSRLLIWLGTRNFQSETKSIHPKRVIAEGVPHHSSQI